MLLDVASEQENRELLLQKHFYSLISSVWKAESRVDRRKNPPPTQNGHYFDHSFFTSMGHNSQSLPNKPSGRISLTNLDQSRKLLAAALDASSNGHQDDKISLSNQRENVPVSTDQLDVTLEFPKDESDTLVSFPSIINLSIQGAEPSPSVISPNGEDHHLRAHGSVAEDRLRYGWIC